MFFLKKAKPTNKWQRPCVAYKAKNICYLQTFTEKGCQSTLVYTTIKISIQYYVDLNKNCKLDVRLRYPPQNYSSKKEKPYVWVLKKSHISGSNSLLISYTNINK